MKYAELFAGAGGLSLGLERAGMTCFWHSEIDPYCQKVLTARFPNAPVYGDVALLNGKELTERHGQLDLLSGGSPCQDMSLAGKRVGLKGLRSNLFFEQMRLWNETKAPLCLWENVYGALSSNDGKDFGRVLSNFVGATVTVPRKKRKRISWERSGVVVGPSGIAAWRVLDAQYFGVAQRRRRVFVIGSKTREYCPAKILLEFKSMCGDSEKGRKKRNHIARKIGKGAGSENQTTIAFHPTQSPISGIVSPALGVNTPGMGVVVSGMPRRLMPVECERLMGWPDNHTDLIDTPDTLRYKAIGNGVASPVAHWIGLQIIKHTK